jgi:hypothetical protein
MEKEEFELMPIASVRIWLSVNSVVFYEDLSHPSHVV